MANRKPRFVVRAPEGVDLRREPNTNSQTEDGNENIIRSVSSGTYVRMENTDTRTTDEGQWALVKLRVGRETVTGWVLAGHLGPTTPIEANPPPVYTFTFEGVSRTITEPNLKTAVDGNIISSAKLTDVQHRIILDRPYRERKMYWASRNNLETIMVDPKII